MSPPDKYSDGRDYVRHSLCGADLTIPGLHIEITDKSFLLLSLKTVISTLIARTMAHLRAKRIHQFLHIPDLADDPECP